VRAPEINLCEELSRMNLASVSNSHFDKKQDMWGYSHASGALHQHSRCNHHHHHLVVVVVVVVVIIITAAFD
jgi:hypothetical protein